MKLKSLFQLGLEQTGLYGLYQIGLISGQIARQTPIHPILPANIGDMDFPWVTPSKIALMNVMSGNEERLIIEADEIVAGNFRCFGGPLRPITLRPAEIPARHWSVPTREVKEQDIKWFWEPARFGWAFTLARAYAYSGDDRYAKSFWQRLEEFVEFNPANAGPNWASAQEVALRLMAVAFSASVLRPSPSTTIERLRLLRGFIAAHAERIPPTLAYSKAQNNNHLLTEAAGLWTAARLLPDHPSARRWNALGQANINRGIQKQVSLDGSYSQYSTNYHRLMLHTAMWIFALYQGQKSVEDIYTSTTLSHLKAAAQWLMAQMDVNSGYGPNYGHNDGANILPLSSTDYNDFRPTLQAAGRIFLAKDYFPPGCWDEACLWLGCPANPSGQQNDGQAENSAVLRISSADSWAILRANRFHSRPAHADQLHVDLWFRGSAITLDAGTYLYNAQPPWENALASVAVHNTIQIDGMEPMTRAGRFLWLDWDQSVLLRNDETAGIISACRTGYRRLGVNHERQLCRVSNTEWRITDILTPGKKNTHTHNIRLHWLVADFPWSLEGNTVILTHPTGNLRLRIDCEAAGVLTIDRAGERLYGEGSANPISGWHSPTYGVRQPSLSICFACESDLPLEIASLWQLPASSK